jgi:hypothetical protein
MVWFWFKLMSCVYGNVKGWRNIAVAEWTYGIGRRWEKKLSVDRPATWHARLGALFVVPKRHVVGQRIKEGLVPSSINQIDEQNKRGRELQNAVKTSLVPSRKRLSHGKKSRGHTHLRGVPCRRRASTNLHITLYAHGNVWEDASSFTISETYQTRGEQVLSKPQQSPQILRARPLVCIQTRPRTTDLNLGSRPFILSYVIYAVKVFWYFALVWKSQAWFHGSIMTWWCKFWLG